MSTRFSDKLLDHFNHPRNAGKMEEPNAVGEGTLHGEAPRIQLYLKVNDQRIAHATFTAFGCGVTIACASALTELASGQPIDECRRIGAAEVESCLDGLPADKRFCAEIAIAALRDAIEKLAKQD